MSKRNDRREAARQARRQVRLQSLAAAGGASEPQTVPTACEFAPVDETPIPLASSPSAAQITANRANAQLSTGPVTPEGKAIVSQNRWTHGLTNRASFSLLPDEDEQEYADLLASIHAEYQLQTDTEQRLADAAAQHYWLMQRALRLQGRLLESAPDPLKVDAQRLNLFLRYQTTHERSYYKAQRELQKIRQDRRKEEIGFESQNQAAESVAARTRLANARALTLEVDAHCRQIMEAPIPGTHHIPFADLAKACGDAIASLAFKHRTSKAAASHAA